jgi:hypothetical protein
VDSDEARDELVRGIAWRREKRMRLAGLLTAHGLERALEPTLTMLADLGVVIADREIARRRAAGEWTGD